MCDFQGFRLFNLYSCLIFLFLAHFDSESIDWKGLFGGKDWFGDSWMASLKAGWQGGSVCSTVVSQQEGPWFEFQRSPFLHRVWMFSPWDSSWCSGFLHNLKTMQHRWIRVTKLSVDNECVCEPCYPSGVSPTYGPRCWDRLQHPHDPADDL